MERLAQQDFKTLSACILNLSTCLNPHILPTHILSALKLVIPSEYSSYNEYKPDLLSSVSRPALEPADVHFPGSDQIFAAFFHEHPIAHHYRKTQDGQALKISDFLQRRQFRNLALYTEFYRRLGSEHQMSITFTAPSKNHIAIALNRNKRDFSERDRLRLNFLRHHLYQAYRNAQAFIHIQQSLVQLQKGLEMLRCGIVLLQENGRVQMWTESAEQLVKEYCEPSSRQTHDLPDEIEQWVKEQQIRAMHENALLAPRPLLLLERQGKRLVVLFVVDHAGHSQLLLREERTTLSPQPLEVLGVTKREAEVLLWVTQGKTNQDIAEILAMKPRTVHKHLEHIYNKLGVENRTAAASRAIEILGTYQAL
jgi:DNA-binding CsgD family transcriptional regulator